MDTQRILQNIGFSPKEALVYLALVAMGKTTPAQIATKTRITRPTAYNILRSLALKGVVNEDLASTNVSFSALPPENLLGSISKKREELEAQEGTIKGLIEEIKLLEKNDALPIPKIRFIEEDGIKEYLLTSTHKLQKSALAHDATWHGFQDKYFVSNFGEWINSVGKQYEQEKYFVNLFTNDSEAEKNIGPISARKLKYIDKALFTSTLWVVGEFIVMISCQKHPHYIVEIHDITMSENLRQFFKTMWNTYKE